MNGKHNRMYGEANCLKGKGRKGIKRGEEGVMLGLDNPEIAGGRLEPFIQRYF